MPTDFSRIETLLVEKLRNHQTSKPVKIMEVCGTHTVSIRRHGIQHLLPAGVKLISGPGCPVCVTPASYINEAMRLAQEGYTLATFGDMVRVPARNSSLENERARGSDIRVIYSPLDALQLAQQTKKRIVFLAIGFETTAPAIAYTLKLAREKKVKNFFVLAGNKRIPPAISTILDSNHEIDGFLLPGHVSTVIGKNGYSFMTAHQVSGVIAGFESFDLLSSLLILLKLIENGKSEVVNNYRRVVSDSGNERSLSSLYEVFKEVDSEWRGLGKIKNSGFALNPPFSPFDIRVKVKMAEEKEEFDLNCRCGEVLKGSIEPPQCQLFGKECHPDHPIGPCMVSSEGSCSAWYHFG